MDAIKSLSRFYNDFTLFQHYQILFLMYINKDSNLISTQHNNTEDVTLYPKTDIVTLDIPKVTNTPDATLRLLTEDSVQTLLQMQGADPFCKYISKHLLNRKAPKHGN